MVFYSLCPFIILLEISTPLFQTFSGPLHRAFSAFVPCIPMLSSAGRLLFQHLQLLQVFFLIERLSTLHHFQKERNLFASSFGCTEGKQHFRNFFPLLDSLNITIWGKSFMQRKLTLETLVSNSLYCQKALWGTSVLPWKTSFCPSDDLSLVRTTYLLYQIMYWFNEMNRAREITYCIISITN